mmetsp:Transcript_6568/g.9816  ORF Transcript_6568/g.9816 Transcript_6568/m.9816 type:complete len:341 (-) Transcript_6568:232-1254(-)
MSKSSHKNAKAKAAIDAATTINTINVINKKQCVQHNYHDHASDKIGEQTFKIGEDDKNHKVSTGGGVAIPFPIKLHNMLEHIELIEPELSHIISWQPHGRCFIVHKPRLFSEDPQGLARFFKQKKYASFQRQLNLYGFNRITKGPDRGSYYHERFLRGKSFLCQGIKRTKVKGTGTRMPSNPDAEPDFYQMGPPMSPTTTTTKTICRHSSFLPEEENMDNIGSLLALPMPPLPDQQEVAYVFGDMPFHGLNQNGSRRHSLMTIQRRNSLMAQLQSSANSALIPNTSENDLNTNAQAVQGGSQPPRPEDEKFFHEMDMITSLGNSDITEQDMLQILDKLIT